ncbi:MAG: hypothetical protein Q7S65_00625 [Nanoarchaeota archaeon]|nr:hypothetical protein [Nanoarchaeota archaeon]
MGAIAVAWIRDGVLVDRMPENAVAFALASFERITPERRDEVTIEELVNWAFDQSGVSVREKMRRYNLLGEAPIGNIDLAEARYLELTQAAEPFAYFQSAQRLLAELNSAGARNYITSAVEQPVLDAWRCSEPVQAISGAFHEVLGSRPRFEKGRRHFEHMRNQGASRIYYVADALKEIQEGADCADLGVVPIGFAHTITPERMQAVYGQIGGVVPGDYAVPSLPVSLQVAHLNLPTPGHLAQQLIYAGAETVIQGAPTMLMPVLAVYFKLQGVLPRQ